MSWNPTVALIVAAVGAVFLGLVYLYGRPRRPGQGRRLFARGPHARREPVLDGGEQGGDAVDADAQDLDWLERSLARADSRTDGAQTPDFDKIVTLHVAARDGASIHGTDLVVAAEKAGLVFGAMDIFHRSVDGRPGKATVFSVASMIKPGSFDLRDLDNLRTPGLSFFMTLPGPLPGLDAWDTMLPAAQRMAELLDCTVLDDRRNTLGRQRIAHIRDDLRAWDRKREQSEQMTKW